MELNEAAHSLSQNLNNIWSQSNYFYSSFKNSDYFKFDYLPNEMKSQVLNSPNLNDFHLQLVTLFLNEKLTEKGINQENSGLDINTKHFRNIADLFTSLELKITNFHASPGQYSSTWKMLQNGIREMKDQIFYINEYAVAFKKSIEAIVSKYKPVPLLMKRLHSYPKSSENLENLQSSVTFTESEINSNIR